MSTLTTQNTPAETVNSLTPDIIAQIHAEIDKIQRLDKNGNLIMTMESLGLTGDIRYVVEGGVPGLSRVDIVMVGANMTNKGALNWIQYNLSDSETTNQNSENFRTHKFKGKGQQKTRLMTVDQTITLLERLPGPNGKRISDHIRKLGRRVIAGDQRMHDEIDANAQNNSDVNVMARVATVIEAVVEGQSIETQLTCDQRLIQEIEQRLIKRQEESEAKFELRLEKINKSERRKKLYDDKKSRNHELIINKHQLLLADKEIEIRKHQLILLEKETETSIKKNKSTIEAEKLKQANDLEMHIKREEAELKLKIKKEEAMHKLEMKKEADKAALEERRLPVAKQYEDLKDREQQRINSQMQQQQLQNSAAVVVTTQPVVTIPQTGSIKYYTVTNVATYFNLYEGLDDVLKNRVTNATRTALINPPYSLKEIGKIEDTKYGKMFPYYNSRDAHIIKSVFELCKKEHLGYDIGYNKID